VSKRKTEKLFDEIRRLADCFGEGEEKLTVEELHEQLRQSGVDPDELRARLHLAAKQFAERERTADRRVSDLLNQAIDSTRPPTDIPRDPAAARKAMDRWLGWFSSPFRMPENLEVCRAYRKTGEVSKDDLDDLNRLEQELKRKVKEESERKT